MTTTADSRKRVVLPAAKPGDRFDVQVSPDGAFILRRLEPVKPRTVRARLVRKDGRLAFELPKGCKPAPHGIEQAVREERDR